MESDTGGLELLTFIDNLFSDPSHAVIDMDRISPELMPLAERLQQLGAYVGEGVSLANGLAEGNLDLINEEHYNPNNPLIPSLATIRTTLAHTLEMAKNVASDTESAGNAPGPLAQRTAETDYATAFDRAIEELRRQNQTLEKNAFTDPLTNLGNRAAFNRAVDLLWSSGKPFTVAFVDIDNLKYCNDTFGHSAGNFYIKQVALYLRLCAEEGEQVFRIGGDEFVLLSATAGEQKLETRLEHYRQMLMKSRPENGIDMIRSFSFGCSRTDPSSGDSRRQMTVDADRKMYGYKLEHKDSLTPRGDTQLGSLMSLGLEDRVFQALAMTNDGRYLFVCNIDKNLSRWSLNAVRDFDLPSEHMRDAGSIWVEHIHPDDREAYVKDIEELFDGRKHHHSMQYRALDASGRYVLCECKGYRLDGNDKMPNLFAGSIINRTRTESTDLATGLNDVRGLIATISECRRTKEPVGFVSIKVDGIADYNGNFGYDTGDGILAEIGGRVVSLARGKMRVFRGRGTTIVIAMVGAGPEDPQALKEKLHRSLDEPVEVEGRRFNVRTHIACTHYPAVVSQPFAVMTELTRRLLCVTEQERALDGNRAALDDDLDPLTGVNREGVFLEKANRHKDADPEQPFCLIKVDLGHLHIYNEWYGKEQGDMLLTEVGSALNDYETDGRGIAGFWGQDDFTLLAADDRAFVDEVFERIRSIVATHDDSMGFVPSIGVYQLDQYEQVGIDQYSKAMFAANQAKHDFSCRIKYFQPVEYAQRENEHRLLSAFQYALSEGRITFHLQPQCDISTGKIVGAEALTRWHTRDGGLVPPSQFIPVLEKSGFIVTLDKYIWTQVYRWIKQQLDCERTVVPVSINISRVDILSFDVCAFLDQLARKFGVPASLVKAEITETAYSQENRAVGELARRLEAKGYAVYMDDFGSGQSSLNMLKSMKVDVVKLDRCFIPKQGDDDKAPSIIKSVIDMSTRLGIPVIVEGVETEAQATLLTRLGARYTQGFGFYRPMPTGDFEGLVALPDLVDTAGIRRKVEQN